MAFCGTCNNNVPSNMHKKIDRIVSGVSLLRLLSEYFDFCPTNPTVCRQCNMTLEQIVKINVKLEKLTIQRNSIISDFSAKLSDSKIIPGPTEIPISRKVERQSVTTGNVSGGENHPVFSEAKTEPEDDTAVYRDKHFTTTQPATILQDSECGKDGKNSMSNKVTCKETSQQKDDISAATETLVKDGNCKAPHPIKSDDRQSFSLTKLANIFQCGICNMVFSESVSLKKHMKKYERESRKFVRCGKCFKTFSSVSMLIMHARTHTVHHCAVCSETFTQPGLLKVHMKIHEEIRMEAENETQKKGNAFKCKQCQKIFPNSLALGEHKKGHKAEKPYLCEWCSKTFKDKGCFECHKRTHTGEKPFMCDFCPAAFKQRTNLVNHIRTHSGEKPYKCDKCMLAFACRSNLTQHWKVHSGEKNYKCEQCSAAFLLPLGLKTHMKSAHSDARPYVCDQCEAAFKLLSHLKRHKLLHTGEKPYKCDQCPATFIQKGNMKIHMKVHNKGNQRSHPVKSVMVSSSFPPQAPSIVARNHKPQAPTVNGLASQTSATDNSCVQSGPIGDVKMGYFPHLWTMIPTQHSSCQ